MQTQMHRNYLTVASVILGLTILLAFFWQSNNSIFNLSKFYPPVSPSARPNGNIILNTPIDNQEVSTSFYIIGEARVFENTFSFRIKNARTNKDYAESSTVTDAKDAGVFGKFNFLLNFAGNAPDLKDGDSLILELFQHSPKDGTEVDKVSVILKYKEAEKTQVKLYFPNPRLAKGFQCAQVFPVNIEVAKNESSAKSSLLSLLKGPGDAERSLGYVTKVDPNTILNNFTISEGTNIGVDLNLAKVPIDKCDKETIIAQITQTLQQFPEIKKVNITNNNKPLN